MGGKSFTRIARIFTYWNGREAVGFNQSLTHDVGTRSLSVLSGAANQRRGATTILSGNWPSQAAYQLKELLAMMK
jgi:hypothetical protein